MEDFIWTNIICNECSQEIVGYVSRKGIYEHKAVMYHLEKNCPYFKALKKNPPFQIKKLIKLYEKMC